MIDKLSSSVLVGTGLTNIESMSGADTVVIIEFPVYEGSMYHRPVYIKMNSIVSLSWSVHRAKVPVTPLGQSTVNGFSLGKKIVAGHIVKTLVYTDELSSIVKYYSDLSVEYKQNTYASNTGSKYSIDINSKYEITQKDFDSVMKDDLVPFNIHSYSISEYTGKMIKDSIYGCTIINTGQVQSIENLITENTIAFVAKNLEQGVDVVNEFQASPSLNTTMSLSRLLAKDKK